MKPDSLIFDLNYFNLETFTESINKTQYIYTNKEDYTKLGLVRFVDAEEMCFEFDNFDIICDVYAEVDSDGNERIDITNAFLINDQSDECTSGEIFKAVMSEFEKCLTVKTI